VTRRGWVLFLVLSVVWGLPYLLIKVAVGEVSVPVVVFARVFLGAAILFPFAVRGGQLAGIARHWRALTAFSVFEFMIPWGLLSHAEVRLTSAMAGLLMATIPIFTISIEKLMGSAEPVSARRVSGLVLGFGGVLVLARPSLGGDSWAVIEVLLAAVSYAAAAIVAARALKSVPALPMVTCCLALAALVYLPAVIVRWPAAVPSLRAIAALCALAVVCTALAFVWYVDLIREAGVARAVVITYTNPAVAVTAGALLLNEPLTSSMVAALALILGGSALATSRARSEGGVSYVVER
jgi:drug/metabolite transporter (DMT)-like permease